MEWIIIGVGVLAVLALVGWIAGYKKENEEEKQAREIREAKSDFEAHMLEGEREWLEKLKKRPYHEYNIHLPWSVRTESEWYEWEDRVDRRVAEIMSEPVSNCVERIERHRKAYAVMGYWPDMKELEVEAYQEEKTGIEPPRSYE